jgi:hypothetical protein
MRSREEIVREVEDRNQFRREAGLPLLDVDGEVRHIQKYETKAELEEAYWNWYRNHPMKEKVKEETLAMIRQRENNPNWRPWGFFSGMTLMGEIHERMRALWTKEKGAR